MDSSSRLLGCEPTTSPAVLIVSVIVVNICLCVHVMLEETPGQDVTSLILKFSHIKSSCILNLKKNKSFLDVNV